MPRKGFERVRTGCITCKARKVKCDEGRPQCLRCKTSGRICEGFRAPPLGSLSWSSLLQVRPSTIPVSESSSTELRSLDFFRCIIAPALTSPLGNSFWTNPVCQLAIQEPAARFAVLAVSLLYERFDPSADDSSTLVENVLALRYYNKAIREVATSKRLDADTTLLISILFICIEFLRGNTSLAIEHCRHGLLILRSMDHPSPDISGIMNHLRIFPFFFGATIADFPLLQYLEYPQNRIHNLSEALGTLDCLMSKCVSILRAFDPFRIGAVGMAELPSSLFLMQQELGQELDVWHAIFSKMADDLEQNDENQTHIRLLRARWHVCKVWLQISSHRDEMFSDTFRAQFERIVELARAEASRTRLSGTERSGFFKFEMGLAPLLYFVVIKCRFLELRLEAWSLLRIVGHAKESLWDTKLLQASGKRVIEREHRIELPQWPPKCWWESASLEYTLPSDSQRIRDSYIEDETETLVGYDGSRMMRRKIFFFVPLGAQKELQKVQDWIYL
ncbi:hypothetical protein F5B22DRAFT_328602 [Xylaria bambusicola]|uniref:uncharacterized protein n=1 Tax=Xylaria bambusicola TaxID=326684 RepID=UPI002007CFD8|nr:uncharacterized protein F5B22DRAFT_328602 [Xylaria bambusicola]KAI0509417.1 hypothetical protein F5B22DRAFT_328602 [Xylaria bambusicola]